MKTLFRPSKAILNSVDASKFSLITKSQAGNKLNLPDKLTVLLIASDYQNKREDYQDFARLSGVHGWNFITMGNPPSNLTERVMHVGGIHNQNIISLYYSAADEMIIQSYSDNYPNTVT